MFKQINFTTVQKTSRLIALDGLRGLIIIVMALDHANLFVAQGHPSAEFWNRTLPRYATPLEFLTRFVTHLAAPGFFFLMGAGIALFAASARADGRKPYGVTIHYTIRGAILIALQLLVENRAWPLSLPENARANYPVYFGVLYGLGAAMIVGGVLVHLDWRIVMALSTAALLAPEFILPKSNQPGELPSPWLRVLWIPGQTEKVQVYYPLIPWVGVTGLGLVLGCWLIKNRERTFRFSLWVGLGSLAGFVVLRVLNGFGNLRPAEGEGWIGFLNVVKYPPSLTFLLFTLGTDLVLLWLLWKGERFLKLPGNPLVIFGRTPLFFYLCHLFLYAYIGLIFAPDGMETATMYWYWLVGLVILYPLCWLYGLFKFRQPANSIWRLF